MKTTPTHRPLIAALVALAAWFWAFPLLGGRGKLHEQDLVSIAALSGNEAVTYAAVAVVQVLFAVPFAIWLADWAGERLLAGGRAAASSHRASMLRAALVGALVAFVLSVFVVHQHTLTEDEKTYLFQSKLLLLGKLSIDVPEGAAAFREPFIVGTATHWSGQYFWAQSALLALGLVAHATYVVPAVEVGCTVFFTGLLAEEVTEDARVGALAAWVAALSPIAVMTGATLLNASLGAACVAVTLWALARLHRRPDRGATWALGLSTAVAVHNRPLDHAAILAGAAAVLFVAHRGELRTIARRLAPAAGIALPFVLLHAPINLAVSGDWRHSGYWLHYQGHDWSPFGFVVGPGGFHNSAITASAKTIANVVRMVFYAAGGPLAFAPVAALVIAGRAPRVLGAAGAVVLAYYGAYFVYASAPIQTTGPAYFDALVAPLAGVVAVAVVQAYDAVARSELLRRRVPALVVAQAVAGVVVFWPPALYEIDRASKDSSACDDLAAAHVEPRERALVFVAKGVAPESFTFWRPMPSPTLDDRVLYPQSLGAAKDAEVVARFGAGRSVYLAHCVGEPEPRIERYAPGVGGAALH